MTKSNGEAFGYDTWREFNILEDVVMRVFGHTKGACHIAFMQVTSVSKFEEKCKKTIRVSIFGGHMPPTLPFDSHALHLL